MNSSSRDLSHTARVALEKHTPPVPRLYRQEYEGGLSHWLSWPREAPAKKNESLRRFVMGQLTIGGGGWVRAVHVRMSDGSRLVVRLRKPREAFHAAIAKANSSATRAVWDKSRDDLNTEAGQ